MLGNGLVQQRAFGVAGVVELGFGCCCCSKRSVARWVVQQVIQRTMGQSDAALWLNLSVRQVKRLVRAIRQDGAQGAVSKRGGVPRNRRIPQTVRDHQARLARALVRRRATQPTPSSPATISA